MARGGLLASLKGFDAFGKTMEDVKIKTRTGALLTLVSAAIICSFTLMEFVDYRRIYQETSVVVDRSRGERLTVAMNLTFPSVPCYLLSLDVMDISGDFQTDVQHDMVKTRLDQTGQRIHDGTINGGPSPFDKMFPVVANDRLLNKPSSLPHKSPPPSKKIIKNDNSHPPPNERNSHIREYIQTTHSVTENGVSNSPTVPPKPTNVVPNNIRTTPIVPRNHVANPDGRPQINEQLPHYVRYETNRDAHSAAESSETSIIEPGSLAGPPSGHHSSPTLDEHHTQSLPSADAHQSFFDGHKQPPKQPVSPTLPASATATDDTPSPDHTDHHDAAHDMAHKIAHILDPSAHHEIDSHNDAEHERAHKIAHILDPNAHHEIDSHNDAEHDRAHKLAHILDPNAHHKSDDHTGHDHPPPADASATPDPYAAEPDASTDLKNELEKTASSRGNGYCGSCYGGEEPESGCCNTCDSVRNAYLLRGWSFTNPELIEQCIAEHWTEKIHEQAKEGCNIAGRLTVNKVIGNIHFSPGRSFLTNSHNVHDLVPYLKNENPHTFGHIIHQFSFENESQKYKQHLNEEMKKRLGIVYAPLDTTGSFHPDHENMYQYFLKVVATRYHFLDESFISSHQYSVTTYERNLKEGNIHKDSDGIVTTHGIVGMPGVFFNYEISPMLIVHHERRQSFAHFITSVCAIVGGVLTVASILDSIMFRTGKVIKKGAQAVAAEKEDNLSRPQYLSRPSYGSSIKMT